MKKIRFTTRLSAKDWRRLKGLAKKENGQSSVSGLMSAHVNRKYISGVPCEPCDMLIKSQRNFTLTISDNAYDGLVATAKAANTTICDVIKMDIQSKFLCGASADE